MQGRIWTALLAGALAFGAVGALLPGEAEASDDVSVIWRDGLRFLADTEHGEVLIRFGGRLHFDTGWGFADLEDEGTSGHAFEPRDEYRIRRARLDLRGSFFDAAIFRVQMDVAGGGISFTDAYVGLHAGPGTLFIGQHTTPFSLYGLWSNAYPMMESPFTMQFFSTGRQLGLKYQMNAADEMLGVALGFYRLSTGAGTTPNQNEWLVGGRVWASLMNDDEDSDLHVGASVNQFIYHENDGISFSTRGAVRTAPSGGRVLQRGVGELDGATLLGVEAGFFTGPLRILSEFAGLLTNLTDDDADNDFLWAVSTTVGFILTEGSQRYSASNAYSPNPHVENPLGSGGSGVVELLMHFDYGNLSDNLDNGAGTSGLQVGLGANWYLNNNMRIMLNFALVNAEDDGNYFLMGMRFQFNL